MSANKLWNNTWIVCFCLLSILTTLGAPNLLSQGGLQERAELSGVVTDPGGATVPDATVTAIQADTQFTREVQTNDSGFYVIGLLPIGNYSLSIERQGFRRHIQSGISLGGGDRKVIDFQLELGEVTAEIEVVGEAPLVDRSDAKLGDNLEVDTIGALPIAGRDFSTLMKLQAGAVVGGHAAYPSASNTGGANEPGDLASVSHTGASDSWSSTNFTMDGVDITQGENGLLVANSLGVESIQELAVSTSNYSAESGRGLGGGVINVISKQGSNDFHGSLFGYYRGTRFQANEFLNNAAGKQLSDFSRNQFGGTIGGPIVTDKLFFFFSYDGIRIDRPASTSFNALSGAFKSQLDPGLRAYFDPMPEPTTLSDDPRIGQAILTGRDTNNNDVVLGRIDWQLGTHLITGRYNWSNQTRTNSATGGGYPQYPRRGGHGSDNIGISWNSTLGPRAINEFGYGYMYHLGENRQFDGFPNPPCPACGRIGTRFGVGNIPFSGQPWPRESQVHSLRDNFRFLRGNHQISTGFDYRLLTFGTSVLLQPSYSYQTLDDLAANSPIAASDFFGFDFFVRGPLITPTWGIYVQDDWKVSPRLTLNLGLRWDPELALVENSNKTAGRHPSLSNATPIRNLNCKICTPGNYWTIGSGLFDSVNDKFFTRPGEDIRHANYNNVSPRVGFAYDLLGDGLTVLRGGYGVVHWALGQEATWGLDIGTNALTGLSINREAFPDLSFPIADFSVVPGAERRFNFTHPNLTSGWSRQWSLSMQRALPGNSVFEVAYLGNRNLIRGRFPPRVQGNPFIPDPSKPGGGARVDPCCGSINIYKGDSFADYHAMQVTFRRSVAQGLDFVAYYTWGHAISQYPANRQSGGFFYRDPDVNWPDGPGSQFHLLERGAGFNDIRHNFLTHFVWELPFTTGNNRFLRGWQIAGIGSARSGNPFDLSGGPQNRYRRSSRPNIVAGASPYTGNAVGRDQPYLNRAAFAMPGPDSEFPGRAVLGNAGRFLLKGPGRWNVDLSLIKHTRLKEPHRIEFRAEVFNLFNHTNWGSDMNTNFLSPTFGRMNNPASASRQVQLGIRYIF